MVNFKKVFAALAGLALILSVSVSAFAADSGYNLNVNGKQAALTEEKKLIIIGGRTLLQGDTFLELFNKDGSFTYNFNEAENLVTIKNAMTTVKLWIDKNEAEINGEKTLIDGATATLKDGKVYIPLRFTAEAFGLTVSWNPQNSTVGVMDDETLDFIYDLLNKQQYNEKTKAFFEAIMDVDMEMAVESEIHNISYGMDMLIEQDITNKFQHVKYSILMDSDLSDSVVDMDMEMYDDGVNSYVIYDGSVTENPSAISLEENDTFLATYSMFDPTHEASLGKNSYAGLTIEVNGGGNYIIKGCIPMPEGYMQDSLDETFSSMGLDDMFYDAKLSMPDPMYFECVINKDTGAFMSMKSDITAYLTVTDYEPELAIVYKVTYDIPKLDFNADFKSVVPEEVKLMAQDKE